VTYEAIRQWCLKFGQDDAHQRKRRRLRTRDTWYLDEEFLTINWLRVLGTTETPQIDQGVGLDHGIGHFMLFEVDSEARVPAPPMPKSP